MGLILNILIRVSIFYFLGEALLFPDDPRFAGKAIPIRNLVVVLTLTLLFPLLYFWKKKWGGRLKGGARLLDKDGYPVWLDNLYLSIFWLDMAGNSFNLYDSYFYFDLIPHLHGTGALAAVWYGAFGLPILSSIGLANIVHILLEAQEYYTDVLFKTHNVRGIFDVVNDLVVGLLGTVLYCSVRFLKGRRTND